MKPYNVRAEEATPKGVPREFAAGAPRGLPWAPTPVSISIHRIRECRPPVGGCAPGCLLGAREGAYGQRPLHVCALTVLATSAHCMSVSGRKAPTAAPRYLNSLAAKAVHVSSVNKVSARYTKGVYYIEGEPDGQY